MYPIIFHRNEQCFQCASSYLTSPPAITIFTICHKFRQVPITHGQRISNLPNNLPTFQTDKYCFPAHQLIHELLNLLAKTYSYRLKLPINFQQILPRAKGPTNPWSNDNCILTFPFPIAGSSGSTRSSECKADSLMRSAIGSIDVLLRVCGYSGVRLSIGWEAHRHILV